jgi:protein-S-isoprenylcysteine O-methyltransferase Ste14
MNDLLALMTIMFWPVIPIFWIPVHFAGTFFRKLGLMTYIMPLMTWIPLAYLLYTKRAFLLKDRIEMPDVLHIPGVLFFIAGTLLHIWTARLLGLWGIIGVPEISSRGKDILVTEGPFSLVRHPTYVAHTLLFSGVFLITGTVSVGVILIADFVVVNAFIIPLEERELLSRFGDAYRLYRKKVPFSFFPFRHG